MSIERARSLGIKVSPFVLDLLLCFRVLYLKNEGIQSSAESLLALKIMAIYPKKKDMLVTANVNAISSYVTSQLSLTELC